MNPKNYCTTGEVALEARVSTATVRQWEKAGRLKAVRLTNGTRLFSRTDVDRVIANRARRADGDEAA